MFRFCITKAYIKLKFTRIYSQTIYYWKARYIFYCTGLWSVIKNSIFVGFFSWLYDQQDSIKQFIADAVYAFRECCLVGPCACFVFSTNSGSDFESHFILFESMFSLLFVCESVLEKNKSGPMLFFTVWKDTGFILDYFKRDVKMQFDTLFLNPLMLLR